VEAESVRAGGGEQSRAIDEQFALFLRPISVLARWFVSISIGSAGVGAVRRSVFARSILCRYIHSNSAGVIPSCGHSAVAAFQEKVNVQDKSFGKSSRPTCPSLFFEFAISAKRDRSSSKVLCFSPNIRLELHLSLDSSVHADKLLSLFIIFR
jgi:hypothetical protein